jgi:Bifunctional DNA primase/polymerase, N-terminal
VTREGYTAEGLVLARLGGQVVSSDDIGVYAVEYAFNGWEIFPLRGKNPYGRCGLCVDRTNPGRAVAKHPTGECVHGRLEAACHGVLDASADFTIVNHWWSGPYAGANIGLRIPAGLFVLDVDPRNGADLDALETTHGQLPATLRCWSGRDDGGHHHYFQHQGGKVSSTRLPAGFDVKTHGGYAVGPPSIHPATGQPYRWEQHPIVAPPGWLVDLLRPEIRAPEPFRGPARAVNGCGTSIADDYAASTSWREILEPHGWRIVAGDGDGDGSGWRHPAADSPCSATIRYGCLFVYSTNTTFEPTEASSPRGYTKFRAYAVLNHGGNLTAAARALRGAA